MSDIDLGFPEGRENAALWLSNRYFPSKIGGKPAWLELDALPSKENLQCRNCGEPMTFLCQIYAPGEETHNFHRSLFVFICRELSCQKANDSSNLSVFRSQLPLKNEFYSEEPPAEDGIPEPEIIPKKKLCQACGCLGPLACSRCRQANYCSSKHQRAMWSTHKIICGSENKEEMNSKPPGDLLFPECEIVIEPNDNPDLSDSNNHNENILEEENKRLQDFEELIAEGKTGTFKNLPDGELDKYVQGSEEVDDKHFRRFKKATSNEPDQILRYKRNGIPLWIANVEKTIRSQLEEIPNCGVCGAVRQFEFQIMPQMLLLLKDERLDWGVIAVYTCSKNCELSKEIGYVKEYIVKQDIVSENK